MGENMDVYNFAAGPAMLPKTVLEQIKKDIACYGDTNGSILELGHRSDEFTKIMNECEDDIRKLLHVSDDYAVLFLQGGASLQFSMVPMNLLEKGKADYIISGLFSQLAYEEAKKFGDIKIAGSTKMNGFKSVIQQSELNIREDSDYVYMCSNNTVYGTAFSYIPDVKGSLLVADMTSDLFTRCLDVNQFDFIFAGAQKNMGISGLCLVIIRKSCMKKKNLPSLLQYQTMYEHHSLLNTPALFPIYIMGLMMKWMLKEGGVEKIEERNRYKAELLYRFIDASSFYQNDVHQRDRSIVNVVMHCPSAFYDDLLIKEAKECGLYHLKGHRNKKGIRISIYNAMPITAVEKLILFMRDFELRYHCFPVNV